MVRSLEEVSLPSLPIARFMIEKSPGGERSIIPQKRGDSFLSTPRYGGKKVRLTRLVKIGAELKPKRIAGAAAVDRHDSPRYLFLELFSSMRPFDLNDHFLAELKVLFGMEEETAEADVADRHLDRSGRRGDLCLAEKRNA